MHIERDLFAAGGRFRGGDGDHGGEDQAGVLVGGEIGAVDEAEEGFVVSVVSGDGRGGRADGLSGDSKLSGGRLGEGELISHGEAPTNLDARIDP